MKKSMLVLVLIVFTTLFSQTGVPPTNGNGTEENPYEIVSLENLLWISQNSEEWVKHYCQMNNIDASDTENWYAGAGWIPIGNSATKFTGSYDGQEYSISNLYIYRPDDEYIGFFSSINLASLTDMVLLNINVEGYRQVGGLVGRAENSAISGCSVNGTVTGTRWTGGMGGVITSTNINYCSVEDIIVNGGYYAGGLAGLLENHTHANCFSTGTVNATIGHAGGLAGNLNSVTLSNSYSSCAVISSGSTAGGFAGYIYGTSTISRCYATGNVTTSGNLQCGGFVGNAYDTNFYDCYARGSASGSGRVGGFIGYRGSSYIYRSYCTGAVNASSDLGGFVGKILYGGIYSSFWNVDTDNLSGTESGDNNSGATGKTTEEMQTQSTFTDADWDFTDLWEMYAGYNDGYPYFQWQFNAPAPPNSPENVLISINEGIVTITWNEVPDATSYKIHSSDTPDGGFTEETEGAFDGFSWSKVVSNSKKFYHVKAVN